MQVPMFPHLMHTRGTYSKPLQIGSIFFHFPILDRAILIISLFSRKRPEQIQKGAVLAKQAAGVWPSFPFKRDTSSNVVPIPKRQQQWSELPTLLG